ncbi:phage-related protein [Virgibacillus halotolerans]|uniref:phage tail domain-containing protein n=1 Tax=Virgibacillus halotolerans TaxID=1071053 RepID=UPI001962237F|nr:phage tail domain-containing protein [Virgibacillus halotolerans]MBM7598078.1 phage-related protein [Virgibacillus halotolerans]
MIRESRYFNFAGIKSTDFGIENITISGGLQSEEVVASKTINEVYIRGRKKPYFIDVSEEPRTIELEFAFMRTWDDRLIDEVIRWLNVDYYQPLYFSEDEDDYSNGTERVYYVIPVNGIELMHYGLKQGYLKLSMRCNSGKGYSRDIATPIYQPWNDDTTGTTDIELDNYGHFSIYPDIWIEKIGDGDITIFNRTNGNQEFKLENIEIGEKLDIDCENEIIETDKERTYRYDDFNDNYLELIYGRNILTITNNAKFQFRYKYIFS